MTVSVQVDPGGEYLLPFAKTKLRNYHQQMLLADKPALTKVFHVSDGAVIYINCTHLGQGSFHDRIRITSGFLDVLVAETDIVDGLPTLWAMRRNAQDTAYEPYNPRVPQDLRDVDSAAGYVFPYDDVARQAGLFVHFVDGTTGNLYRRPTGRTSDTEIPALTTSGRPITRQTVPFDIFTTPPATGIGFDLRLYDFSRVPGEDEERTVYRTGQTTDRGGAVFPGGSLAYNSITLFEEASDVAPDLYLLDVRRYSVAGVATGGALYYDKYRVLGTIAPTGQSDAQLELVESVTAEAPSVSATGITQYPRHVGQRDTLDYAFNTAVWPPAIPLISSGGTSVPPMFNRGSLLLTAGGSFSGDPFSAVTVNIGAHSYEIFNDTMDAGHLYMPAVWTRAVRIEDDEYWFVNVMHTKYSVALENPSLPPDPDDNRYEGAYPVVITYDRWVFKNGEEIEAARRTDVRTLTGQVSAEVFTWSSNEPIAVLIPTGGYRIDGADWFVGYQARQTFPSSGLGTTMAAPAQFLADESTVYRYDVAEFAFATSAGLTQGYTHTAGPFAVPRTAHVGRSANRHFFVFVALGTAEVYAVPLGSDEPAVLVTTEPILGRSAVGLSSA